MKMEPEQKIVTNVSALSALSNFLQRFFSKENLRLYRNLERI